MDNYQSPSALDECLHHRLPKSRLHVTMSYLNDTLDVAMSFSEILGTKLGSSFTVFRVRLEDSSGTFTLGTNNTSHIGFCCRLRAAK